MSRPFGKTTSVCPVCLKVIPAAKTVGGDGFIHLEKTCPEHGFFDTLIWEGGLMSYATWGDAPFEPAPPKDALPVKEGCPHDCGLCEAHQREGCCVLLELTKRCDLRCPVCFASAGETAGDEPDLAAIGRQFDYLMSHGGPFNIQLSGGEPTMRDDLPEIMALGRERGFSFFQLNTNGLRLARKDGYAETLKAAGLSCVFLQFDGVTEEPFRVLRGRPLLNQKKEAIARCREAGLPVVLVPTVAPEVNDGELGAILEFALERAPHIRGVHFQPMSYFGRCEVGKPPVHRLTIPRILKLIEDQTQGRLKAEDFGGGGAESPYCSFHAAYRVRPDGTIKALQKRRASCCCDVKSSEARDFVSRQWGDTPPVTEDVAETETSALDAFIKKAVEETFTVSGMLFQDAYNLDLERLKRCYICEADEERGLVPFCAYNLTDTSGRALYRGRKL